MKYGATKKGVRCDKFIRNCPGDYAEFTIVTDSVRGHYCLHCSEQLAKREEFRINSLLKEIEQNNADEAEMNQRMGEERRADNPPPTGEKETE